MARHPELARLVREEVIKPTVAGEINRLPTPVREATIVDVQQGTVRTVADVRRRRQATAPSGAHGPALDAPVATVDPPLAHTTADTGESIPAQERTPPPAASGQGVVISLSPAKMFTEVQTQIEAIAALAAMIDARTLAGQAVLKAVQHDLAAAYEKLATYLRRHEGAPK